MSKIRPVVYKRLYQGLESVPEALKDISSRKVWGKAVIRVSQEPSVPQERQGPLQAFRARLS